MLHTESVIQVKLGPRARKGAVTLGVGVLVLIVVFVAKLGWTGFFPALAIMAAGSWLLVRGQDSSGPRTMFAYCVALVVVFVGVGWVHPQRWAAPGFKLDKPGSVLIARRGGSAIFFDNGFYSSRSLSTGSQNWRFHSKGTSIVFVAKGLAIRSTTDPAQAEVRSLSTGQVVGTEKWPAHDPTIATLAPGKPLATASGKPTPAQLAKMPKLTSREHVIAVVGWEGIAARLDAAVDPTGHHYTRLDIVDGPTSETYRVSGATGLQLYQGVLVVDSSQPHVMGLLRHAPKGA